MSFSLAGCLLRRQLNGTFSWLQETHEKETFHSMTPFPKMTVYAKTLLVGLVLVCCAGCAVSIQHGLTNDYLQSTGTTNEPNLILIRESQFIGGAVLMELLIDSTVVAGIASGEYVRLYLAPGQHIISARIYTGRTGYLPILMPSVGKKFYEMSMNLSGELNFLEINPKQVEDFMQGKKEISQLPESEI